MTVSGVLGLTVGAATESGKEGDRVREERGEGGRHNVRYIGEIRMH